jgi:hypothetical protein
MVLTGSIVVLNCITPVQSSSLLQIYTIPALFTTVQELSEVISLQLV